VIADFGLAQSVLADEYLFARCGTPGFVAPEIVNLKDRNAKYTCACDLFSLGIIFHMLLLNKSPFPGKEYNEVLSQNRASSFNFDSYECK
jgi:calcium-dependent protein kinase